MWPLRSVLPSPAPEAGNVPVSGDSGPDRPTVGCPHRRARRRPVLRITSRLYAEQRGRAFSDAVLNTQGSQAFQSAPCTVLFAQGPRRAERARLNKSEQ